MVGKIAANVCDWRSKSLAPMLMVNTTLNGFYFANRFGYCRRQGFEIQKFQPYTNAK